MKKLVAMMVACVLSFTVLLPGFASAAADYSYIRVKLSSMGNPSSVQFKVAGAYRVSEASAVDLFPGITYTAKAEGTGIKLSYASGAGTVTHTLPAAITLVQYENGSSRNCLYVNNPSLGWRYYSGNMTFLRADGASSLQLINTLFIETYLYGVVGYEMGNDWPAEALKAQAVCSRTYAMNRIKANPSAPWHVVDTSSDQVYMGIPYLSTGATMQNVINAVNATRAMAVVAGEPSLLDFASGQYSASNGGQIRNTATGDEYDLRNPSSPRFTYIFPKSTDLAKMNLLSTTDRAKANTMLALLMEKLPGELLAQHGIACTAANISINGVKSASPETLRSGMPSGSKEFTRIAVTVNVTATGDFSIPETLSAPDPTELPSPMEMPAAEEGGGGGMPASHTCDVTVILAYISYSPDTAGELRTRFTTYSSLLGTSSLWLLYTDVSADGEFLYVVARGYGHGKGMSQRGAQQMAQEGKAYTDITSFYFSGCAITAVGITEKVLEHFPGKGSGANWVKVTATKLNVRAAAGTKGTLVGSLPKNDVVEVIGTSGNWHKILKASTGLVGYVASQYVAAATAPTATPAATATATGGSTAGTSGPSATPSPLMGRIVVSKLNMRSQPGTSGSIVTKLARGSNVVILDTNAAESWYKVQYLTHIGYCMRQNGAATYLELISGTADPGVSATASSGAFAPQTVSAKANLQSGYLVLRSSASTTASKVAEIPNGGSFTVQQVHTDAAWLKVTYSGKTGYVLAKYAKIGGSSSYKACTVTGRQLNVRGGAGTGNAIIGTLKAGNTVLVTAKVATAAGTWYKLQSGSAVGYIDARYARISTP